MSCSPARIAANRANALKSSGPKSAEGKAASRLNAFQHGMAGEGDLVGPGEDAELIAARSLAFAAELDAPGAVGLLLAHRAALLSVRMKNAADRELAVVAADIQAAHDQFDADRRDAFNSAVDAFNLALPGDIRPALQVLETTPEGLAYLTLVWSDLARAIDAGDPAASTQATHWLGLTAIATGSPSGSLSPADLSHQVATEIHRIEFLAELVVTVAAVAARRNEAGLIASFDPSPAATLARRYEAAAERGMYRAIRAIADLRRDQAEAHDPLPPELPLGANLLAPPPRPLPTHPPMGSFRAEAKPTPALPFAPLTDRLLPPSFPTETRKKRPDLRKIGSNRR